ncbi:MAG TPA: IPT/TIG domain-containing protein [Planctomycetota bacterium]|nr:IPT/TIG domain-containing protein [Planctomycetota bacterium]
MRALTAGLLVIGTGCPLFPCPTPPPYVVRITPPTITSITPASGPSAGNTSVTVTGTGFDAKTVVLIGGRALLSPSLAQGTTITGETPPGSPGQVDVVVTNGGGTATLTGAFTYTTHVPTITSISPNSGTTGGGTFVTIVGTGFVAGTTATVGGVSLAGLTVVSATTITGFTPSGAAGQRDVVVTGPGGSATLSLGFTFVTPIPPPTVTSIVPSTGSTTGGTYVTITGTGFDFSSRVAIGGLGLESTLVASSTTIRGITRAAAAGAKTVTVESAAGTGSLAAGFNCSDTAPPTVNAIDVIGGGFQLQPTGDTNGGTLIQIDGSGFTGGTTATVGSSALTNVVVLDGRTIRGVTPPGTAGMVAVVVQTPNGASSGGPSFAYSTTAPPSITSVTPSSGPIGGATSVTITGSGFLGATGASIGGSPLGNFSVVDAHTITGTTAPGTAGSATVAIASPNGNTSASFLFSYAGPAVPATLAFRVEPGTGVAGALLAPPVVEVVVLDSNGQPCGTVNPVTLTLGANPTNASLTGNVAQTANGLCDFPALSIDRPGSGYTLIASAPGLTSATSAAFSIVAAPAWTHAGAGLAGATINALAIDASSGGPSLPSQTLYAATPNGLWKTANAGASWSQLTVSAGPGLTATGFSAVAVDAPEKAVYAIGIEVPTLFKSDDGGATWVAPLAPFTVDAIAVDPNTSGTAYVLMSGFVLRSKDAGANWDQTNGTVFAPGGPPAMLVAPGAPSTIFVSVRGSGIFRSTDAGASFAAANAGLPTTNVLSMATDPSGATLYTGTDAGVFSTSTATIAWSGLAGNGDLGTSLDIDALAVDPGSPRTIYLATDSSGGGVQSVWRSTDGGATFAAYATGIPLLVDRVTALAVDPNAAASGIAYAGHDVAGVFARAATAGSWSQVSSGLDAARANAVWIDRAHPTHAYASVADRVFFSSDGGATFAPATTQPAGVGILGGIATDSTGKVYVGSDAGVFASSDFGQTWSPMGLALPAGTLAAFPIVDPTNDAILYVGGVSFGAGPTRLFRYNGTSWAASVIGLPASANVWAIAVDPTNGAHVFAAVQGGASGVYESQDSGSSWSQVAGLAGANPSSGASLAIDSTGDLLYADASIGVFSLPHLQTTFSSANAGLPLAGGGTAPVVRAVAYGSGTTFYVALAAHSGSADPGVWKTTDGGATWAPATSGIVGYPRPEWLAADATAPGDLLFAGEGGIYQTASGGQ